MVMHGPLILAPQPPALITAVPQQQCAADIVPQCTNTQKQRRSVIEPLYTRGLCYTHTSSINSSSTPCPSPVRATATHVGRRAPRLITSATADGVVGTWIIPTGLHRGLLTVAPSASGFVHSSASTSGCPPSRCRSLQCPSRPDGRRPWRVWPT